MKILLLMKLQIVELYRNKKKSVLFITIISVIFISMSISYGITSMISESVKSNLIEDIANREVIIRIDRLADATRSLNDYKIEIEAKNHIKYVYPSVKEIDANVINDKMLANGLFTITSGSPEHIPSNVNGRKFTSADTNVAIIPSEILIYPLTKNQRKVNGIDYLGDNITLVFENSKDNKEYRYTYEIIGVYKSNTDMAVKNNIFVPLKDLYNIMSTVGGNDLEHVYENEKISTLTAIIDEQKYVTKVMEEISNLKNIKAFSIKNNVNNNVYDAIVFVAMIIFLLILAFALITLNVISENILSNKNKEFSICMAIGYKSSDIYFMMLFYIFIISCVAFLINCVLGDLILGFIALLLQTLLLDNSQIILGKIKYINLSLLMFLLMNLTILAVCYKNIRVFIKKKPSVLLKENAS